MDVVAFARRNWMEVGGVSVAIAGLYFGVTRPDTLLLGISILAFGAVVAHID